MIPARMAAVQLTGHGGNERLIYRTNVPVVQPAPDVIGAPLAEYTL